MTLATPAFPCWAPQGVPLKVISEIVGHSDIRLTQNVYQHVYSEARQAAANTMDTLITGLMKGESGKAIATDEAAEKPVATKTVPQSVN